MKKLLILVLCGLLSPMLVLAQQADVDSFTPQGEVRRIQQVAIAFNRDMVRLGQGDTAAPIAITCPQGGAVTPNGRWLDTRRYVLEWPRDLPIGTRCTVTLNGGTKTLDGADVRAAGPWHFSTGGPKLVQSLPYNGESNLREHPVFLLRPDAQPDAATVDQHLACQTEGAAPARMQRLTREEGLREMRQRSPSFVEDNWDVQWWMAYRCERAFPNSAKVRVIWSAHIAALSGVASRTDQIFNYVVRPPFTLSVTCGAMEGNAGCDPRTGAGFAFTWPVMPGVLPAIKVTTGDGQTIKHLPLEHVSTLTNHATQPFESLQEGGKFTVSLSEPLYDTDGRVLANARDFPKSFTVAKLPPYLGFVQQASVLPIADRERAQLVIAARYVEQNLVAKAVRVGGAQGESGEKAALGLLRSASAWDNSGGGAYPLLARHARGLPHVDLPVATGGGTMNFHGLPLDKPGVWLVELDSARFRASRKAEQRPVHARASLVQVTNLNLAVRAAARGESLVWVTAIDSGKPVGDADVAYYDCTDKLMWRGKTGADGVARLQLGATCGMEGRFGEYLVVRKGDDLAALQVGSGQFFPVSRGPGPFGRPAPVRPGVTSFVSGHTLLDRTLFKAGETLHLENHVREQTATGFRHLPPARGTLEILFNFGEAVHKAEVQWNEHGAAQATWRIPANAKLGRYVARIRAEGGNVYDAQFQIEEYRAPVFDAKLTGAPVWRGEKQELPVEMSLNYLSGGAGSGEAVSLRGRWTMGAPSPVPGFDFTNRRIAPFPQRNEAPRALRLDDKGEARTNLTPPETPHAVTLFAEMQFSDPNGEVQTVAQRYPVWPYPNKLGLRTAILPDAATGGPRGVELTGLVLDSLNKPLSGKNLRFSVARARAERGFHVLTGEENPACDATTAGNGEARCTWRPASLSAISNNEVWLITAQADGEKPIATSILYDWQMRWTPSNTILEIEGLNARDSNATLTPDKPAQLRVRAPFTPATLLLTVAREGVLAHSVHDIGSADVRLPLDIKGHYAPNVQIAANFARALTQEAEPAALHAQHVITARVTPTAYALRVTVKPAREEARPRERVPLTVSVRKNDGNLAPHARVTVIAVDDALLALRPNGTWNLFAAMTRERGVAVQNHVLLAGVMARAKPGPQWDFRPGDEYVSRQVAEMAGATIGIRGLDAARVAAAPPSPAARAAPAPLAQAPGAGGNEPAVRSDFSTLALWLTDVVTDGNGNATVEVPLNDSLTRWRIVAVATHDADKFGTGDTTLRTVQPLQVVSGLPLSVRSGDALEQKITLRNTSKETMRVEFSARAQLTASEGAPGKIEADAARGLHFTRAVTLKPEENQSLTWPVSVPDNVERIQWRISAKSADIADTIEIEQVVTPAVPVTVRQAMLLQVEKSTLVPVAQPTGARAGAGGVSVDWKASLGDAALIEVRRWMKNYPFICLEQKTSKLATLGDRDGWDLLMRELPKYLDGNGLARYFPTTQLPGSETLTMYVLDTAAALKWNIPAAEKARMLNGLRAQLAGRTQALDWAPQDVSVVRALSLQATLSEQAPGQKLERVVTPVDMAALPTTALVDWVRYLLVSPKDTTRAEALKEAANTLRSRYDVQGTRLNWRNEARENWWWFMWNGNVAAARTAWIVNRWSAEDATWRDDLPLLVTGLVGRQQQGHWGTTTANVWGSIALADFARVREAEPVTGASTMRMAGQSASVTWPTTATTTLGWPKEDNSTLTLSHAGTGAPWATVAVRAAVKLEKPVSQGLTIARTVTPIEQKVSGQWRVGDTARVTLTLSSSAALTWVVVRDPVPSGATILGRGLARESTLAQQGQQRAGAWPVFEERAAESYRGYYRFVPQGQWSVEYTVRINNAGTFEFPPARVEAMYAPEIFGETPVAPLVVRP